MESVSFLNRKTKKMERELVYGEAQIRLLYGKTTWGNFLLHSMAKWPFFSWVFGCLQKRSSSKKKVLPFIKEYGIDASEFEAAPESYTSFNDFFIRKLKATARPLASGDNVAIMPADARYQFFPVIGRDDPFTVKGHSFSLQTLLQDHLLASKFENGSMLIARLCPTDCHRFYFPVDCTPSAARPINGWLFSVNPIAIKDNPWIYLKNRRVVTVLETKNFGTVAYLEIGATSCGSIHQTYEAGKECWKGDEKGYFEFGGSALILLFEKGKIEFDEDLVEATKKGLEIRCLIGESLGKAKS